MHSSRRPYVIGVIAFVVLFGLGVLALSRTGGGPPAATPSQTPTPKPSITEGAPTSAPDPATVKADQGTTVVRLDLDACEDCQVVALAADAAAGQSQWSASVDQGTANVEVPTPNTLGMRFLVKDPRRVQEDTANTPDTIVYLAPKGTDPGSAVSAKTLTDAGSGHYCWAGTTLDTAIITLGATVERKALQEVWANPALPTLPPNAAVNISEKATDGLQCPAQ